MSNKTTYGFGTPHGFKTPHKFPSKNTDNVDYQNLTFSLFPTGAVWDFDVDSEFENILLAINDSFLAVNDFGVDVINSIIPDNDYFSDEDLTLMNYIYGLPEGSTIDDLKRKLAYYNKDYSKQSLEYLQHIIDVNGYDAKVYPNLPPYTSPFDVMANSLSVNQHAKTLQHGKSTQHGSSNYDVIANESFDESFSYGGNKNLWATFFIASRSSLYNSANIPSNKVEDFKKLILKVKPAHLVAFLFI